MQLPTPVNVTVSDDTVQGPDTTVTATVSPLVEVAVTVSLFRFEPEPDGYVRSDAGLNVIVWLAFETLTSYVRTGDALNALFARICA